LAFSISLVFHRRCHALIAVSRAIASSIPGVDAVEMLAIDEPCQPVFSAELGALSSPMLDNARGKVARYADVKRAVRAVCHNVHPAASHSSVLADVQHGCQPTLA
jgi:hypothetical protein